MLQAARLAWRAVAHAWAAGTAGSGCQRMLCRSDRGLPYRPGVVLAGSACCAFCGHTRLGAPGDKGAVYGMDASW